MANIVEILVTGKNLARPAMESATADAKGLGGVVGKMAAISTVALAGIAVESVKMASDFQSATTRLVTSAGETTANIDLVRKGMLDMASQVGISAIKLADGMYTVESAGYHGANGLTVLKAAAQGAKAENADLATVSNAVTDVLVDYHLKASDAADVTSKLITAVSFGKTSFQDLSGAMHTVLPLAASLHLSMADVTGVLAEMTAHGVSADQATQQMANAMRNLAAPTNVMKKEFKELGVTSDQVTSHLSSSGLSGTLEYLSKVALKAGAEGTPAYTEALKKLTGTASGLQVALLTTGENAAGTQAAIKGIGAASADAKGDVKGFSEVQATLAQKVDELKAGFDTLMISIGNKLIPVLTQATGFMLAHKGALVDVLGGLTALMGVLMAYSVVMKTIAAVQGIAAAATKVWTAAVWLFNAAMDADPLVLVAIAIAALIAGIIYAYFHFQTFRNIVDSVMNAVKTVVMSVVDALIVTWHGLVTAAEAVWHGLEAAWGAITSSAKAVGGFLSSTWEAISHGVSTVWNGIINFFKKWWPLLLMIFALPLALLLAAWNHWHTQITDTTMAVWNAVSDFFVGIWHWIEGVARTVWGAIKTAIVGPMVSAWHSIVSVWNTVSGWLSSAWHWIEGVARTVWGAIKTAIVGPAEQIWSQISSIFSKIKTAISSQLNAAWSAVSNIGSKFWSVGSNIVRGIINGVENAGGALFDTMKNLADNALKSAESFLGISSPSKKAGDRIGKWLPHGIAKGALDNAGVAYAAMKKLSSGLLGSGSVTGGRSATLPSSVSGIATSAAAGAMAQGGGTVVLEIHSGGTKLDDALVEIIRKAVRLRGAGNVQTAFGRS